MDTQKVAMYKPARGKYDAAATYAYHSEFSMAKCLTAIGAGAIGGAFGISGLTPSSIAAAGLKTALKAITPGGWAVIAISGVIGGVAGSFVGGCWA